jgi:tetratricopeptide (TPR) repeat protein
MKTLWLLAGVVFVLAGCATTPRQPAWKATGDPLVDGRMALQQGPPEDRVLWQYRMAVTALRRGQFEEAKSLLDDAILTMGGIIQGDKSARRARSYFAEESRKIFRGEPYERVMAFYYRGILYWMDGERDNARACFRSAQFHDSDTENREYASDYVLLEYLDGLATAKLAGDGSDNFKRSQELARQQRPPPYNKQANALFFVEMGQGPTKFATGEHREQLRFRPGKSTAHGAVIKVGNQAVKAEVYDDLTFQATTRGGRVMDHILANKAVFKSTTDSFGTAAIISGAVVAHQHQEVGLGLVAAGLLSKIVSAATTPAADVRAWDNLPQYLSFAKLELPPGEHQATIIFYDANGIPLANRTQTVTLQVRDAWHDTVIFVSDRS